MTKKVRYAAGIDLGGTFVKLALVSEDGKILFSDKLEIGSKATRDAQYWYSKNQRKR